ncbi:MAG: carboxypeptidase regulatory-like domain-containing protein [Acidobacteriia bacterium]|nr:carboxypeptidase regulatory-like domain-containing protein [Terriglobia bacterium]
MRLRLGSLLFLFAAPLCLAQHGGHQLAGYVREEPSNVPVQSVALDVLSSGTRAAPPVVSGMDGEFQFASLRDGDYYIVATKKGYDTVTTQVSILAASAPPIVIYLHKQDATKPSGPEDSVTTRQLSIPEKARESLEKGRKLLYEKSEPEKSIAQFQHAIDQFPAYYEAYTQVGVADYRLQKFPDAEKALRKAIEISSQKYPEALHLLAAMFNDQERFAESEPLARQAIVAGDASWHGPFELARALVGLKRGPEAEASAVQARDLKPDNAQVYLLLANAHIQQQKFSLVVQDFDEYLKLAPNAPNSAPIRRQRDRIQEALRHAQPQAPAPKP